MPPTVDTAAHTSERLARNVNITVSRIAPVLPSVTAVSESGPLPDATPSAEHAPTTVDTHLFGLGPRKVGTVTRL